MELTEAKINAGRLLDQHHHDASGGVVGPAWFGFPLLEECQMFSEDEVLRSQRAARLRRSPAGEPPKIYAF